MVCTGAYDEEDAAARAYDLAALKYWGRDTILNFPVIFLGILFNSNTKLIRKRVTFHMIFVCFAIFLAYVFLYIRTSKDQELILCASN